MSRHHLVHAAGSNPMDWWLVVRDGEVVAEKGVQHGGTVRYSTEARTALTRESTHFGLSREAVVEAYAERADVEISSAELLEAVEAVLEDGTTAAGTGSGNDTEAAINGGGSR